MNWIHRPSLLSAAIVAAPLALAGTASAHIAMAHKPAMHPVRKTVMHDMHRTDWTRKQSAGAREVFALNAMEAAGYRHFTAVHAVGATIAAEATKNNHSYNLTIMPDGRIVRNG